MTRRFNFDAFNAYLEGTKDALDRRRRAQADAERRRAVQRHPSVMSRPPVVASEVPPASPDLEEALRVLKEEILYTYPGVEPSHEPVMDAEQPVEAVVEPVMLAIEPVETAPAEMDTALRGRHVKAPSADAPAAPAPALVMNADEPVEPVVPVVKPSVRADSISAVFEAAMLSPQPEVPKASEAAPELVMNADEPVEPVADQKEPAIWPTDVVSLAMRGTFGGAQVEHEPVEPAPELDMQAEEPVAEPMVNPSGSVDSVSAAFDVALLSTGTETPRRTEPVDLAAERAEHARDLAQAVAVPAVHASTVEQVAERDWFGHPKDGPGGNGGVTAESPFAVSPDAYVKARKAPATKRRRNGHPRRRGVRVSMLAAVIALALGLAGGGAYAYFHSSGSGTGTGTAGALANVTVANLSATTNTFLLQPGGTGSVIVKVTNGNSFHVTLKSVVGNGAITADPTHVTGGCAVTGVTFTDQPSLSIDLPPGTTTVEIAAAASMSASSSSGCQGATFTIPVTITVRN